MDTRHKDVPWIVRQSSDGTITFEQARLAVLMDLRDELKELNRLLHCHNFTGLPAEIQAIRRRVCRRRRKAAR